MTDPRHPLRPDARLVRLHAERGDPGARLAQALADLESAAWGLLLSGEDALARQLAAALGRGTLRVDARLRVNREALASAGLAAASLDGEWRGAQGVWLLEPDAADFARARRAGVPVIVDGTLAPGGQWLSPGAALVVYRDSVTLTGHGDAPLAAVFGSGRPPVAEGHAPSDLSVALALRDVATLPLRLARAARTAAQLAERLGGAAQTAGPTALLLAPDAAADTAQHLGGVLAAARNVPGGVLLTPGLEEADACLALLRAAGAPAPVARPAPEPPVPEVTVPDVAAPQGQGRDQPRDQGGREVRPRRDRDGRDRPRGGSYSGDRRADRPAPRPDQPSVPERFTFEAPARATAPEPAAAEETWEPEIVYSDIAQAQVRLPTPVSSGPDAPNLGDQLPDVLHQPSFTPDQEPADQEEVVDELEAAAVAADVAPAFTPPAQDAGPGSVVESAALLAPDLPEAAGKDDPTANLTEEQAVIFGRLRDWRNAEAKRQELSRFIIASNATLAEIARRVPYTEADLKAVRGMGPERVRKYGEQILSVVRG